MSLYTVIYCRHLLRISAMYCYRVLPLPFAVIFPYLLRHILLSIAKILSLCFVFFSSRHILHHIFTMYWRHLLCTFSSHTPTIYRYHLLSSSLSIFFAIFEFSPPYIVSKLSSPFSTTYIVVIFLRHILCISSQSITDLSSTLNLFASLTI